MSDRKRRRTFLYFLFILFIPVLTTADQQFEAQQFTEWMNKENTSFKKYQDARDAEFVKFLDSTWKEFQISSGLVSDKSPKPKNLPVAPEKPLNIPTPPEPTPEPKPPVPDSTPPVFRIAPLAGPDEEKPGEDKKITNALIFFSLKPLSAFALIQHFRSIP